MKPNKAAKDIKDILKIVARIEELNNNWKPRVIPLKDPIFAGHWRHIALREDVLRCSIGADAAKVVALCDHWVLGKKKEPKSYNCQTEICLEGNTLFIMGQYLRPLSQAQIEEACFSPRFIRKWFHLHKKTVRLGTKNMEYIRYFPKIGHHMVEFAFRRGYIVEVTEPNGNVESELAKLYQKMEHLDGWRRLGQTKGQKEKKTKATMIDKIYRKEAKDQES